MGMLFQVLVCYLSLVAGIALCQQQQTAGEADRVVALPGQPAVNGFGLYAGNVNVAPGRDLFYVFAQCSNDAAGTKPLVIWFNGGAKSGWLAFSAFLTCSWSAQVKLLYCILFLFRSWMFFTCIWICAREWTVLHQSRRCRPRFQWILVAQRWKTQLHH